MPTSKDPKRRQAQLRNLRADAATTHGAYSEAKLGPLRARFAGELAAQFGSVASPEEIEIAADRRARIQVITDWLNRRGVMADKRSGRPREILATLERSQAALERQLGEWRRRGGGARREPRSDHRLELSPAEKVGLMASDERVRAESAQRVLQRTSDEQHADYLRSTGVEESAVQQALERRQAASQRVRRRLREALSDEDLDALEDLVEGAEAEPAAPRPGTA